jgi:hypothetical protein
VSVPFLNASKKGHNVSFIVCSGPQGNSKQTNAVFKKNMMPCHWISQSPATFGLVPQGLIDVQP